ncbi:MAG: mechanosensitive ion channel [Ruminiclostridium sp.]|nr:mechanosensitive ion channel [Ruminiclostridium sp.]
MNYINLLDAATADETVEEVVEVATESVNRVGDMITGVWNGFVGKLPTIIIAIVILIVGMLVSKIVLKIMGKAMDKSKLDLTISRFAQSAVKIVLNVLVIIIALTTLGVPMDSIIAVVATAGVAVGLALQNSLSNLAGGFLILIEKPFKVGSYIKCGGEEGVVEAISILYTKIMTVDNKAVFVPNGTAANSVVVNFSDPETRRVDHIINISYNEDLDKAIASINKAIEGNAMILREGDKAPFIRLVSQDASSLGITVRLWGKASDYWAIYFDSLEAIRRQFVKDGIDVPYSQLDVHIKNN